VPDATVHAWVDDRLSPQARAAVEAWLQADPAQWVRALAWREQTLQLRAALAPLLDDPHALRLPTDAASVAASGPTDETAAGGVPIAPSGAAGAGAAALPPSGALGAGAAALPPSGAPVEARAANQPWRNPAGWAAALAVAVAVGVLVGRLSVPGMDLRAALRPSGEPNRATGIQMAREAAHAWVAYSPEVRHPVEVAASDEQHMVTWLSKRIAAPAGHPIRVPVLLEQGWRLLGGRLLPGAGEIGTAPVALFMYENGAGKRLSLMVRRELTQQETAFSFLQEGATRVWYWVDGGFGYALAGDISQEELANLGRVVYAQLNP
jgi:anti-sigma factor RsiW